jgi:hypothetical protein
MNELQVIVNQKPAEITFNFDEIKVNLSEQMEIYKTMEVTEEVLVERKKDIATLRKIAKAIDDKRKEVKTGYMIPFEEFDMKAKELIEIINEPIDLINKQVKEFDEKQKAEKKQKAYEYYLLKMGGQSETLEFEEVFKDSWLNVATSFKSIKSDIDKALEDRLADLETITSMHSEVESKALEAYRKTKRLADAMRIINDYEAQKKAILEAEEKRRRDEDERKKREEERKAREEQARLEREQREREAAAEREKQAEIECIRAEERARARAEMQKVQTIQSSPKVEPQKEEWIPIPEGPDEVQFPGAEEHQDEEEIAFPGDELAFPGEDDKSLVSPDQENYVEVQEETLIRRYIVKATAKQHDMIEKTLDGLGVEWSV